MSAGILENNEREPTVVEPVSEVAPKRRPALSLVAPSAVAPVQPAVAAKAADPVLRSELEAPRPGPTEPAGSRHAGAHKILPTDAVFDLTAELAAIRRESTWRFVVAMALRWKEVRHTVVRIRSLPHLSVPLIEGSTGSRELTKSLRKSVAGFHPRTYAVAVLDIPAEAGAYRRGRPRQALRTNSTKARAEGTTCVTLTGQGEILYRFGQIIVDGWGVDRTSRRYRRWIGSVQDVPHAAYFAALAEDTTTLVFCKVVFAGEFAWLHTFIQDSSKPASRPRLGFC